MGPLQGVGQSVGDSPLRLRAYLGAGAHPVSMVPRAWDGVWVLGGRDRGIPDP